MTLHTKGSDFQLREMFFLEYRARNASRVNMGLKLKLITIQLDQERKGQLERSSAALTGIVGILKRFKNEVLYMYSAYVLCACFASVNCGP